MMSYPVIKSRSNRPYQICNCCVMDTTDEDIIFDLNGWNSLPLLSKSLVKVRNMIVSSAFLGDWIHHICFTWL